MDNVEDAPRHGESRRQGKAFRPRVGVDVAAHGGLLRSEPSREFTGADGLDDRRVFGCQLVAVAVAARDNAGAAQALFTGNGGREKIIGLISGRLGRREPAGSDEFREYVQLLDQLIVEDAARPGTSPTPRDGRCVSQPTSTARGFSLS